MKMLNFFPVFTIILFLEYVNSSECESIEPSSDQKPPVGSVIPITVEQLSSADSNDSSYDKHVADKNVDSPAASESTSAGSKSKLLLLQMASMFVEAANASQQNTSEVEAIEEDIGMFGFFVVCLGKTLVWRSALCDDDRRRPRLPSSITK